MRAGLSLLQLGCCAALSLVTPPRVARLLNASPAERAALVEALEEVTGEQWQHVALRAPSEYRHARLAELRGCDPLDAQCAAELLDESLEEPLLLVALPYEEREADGERRTEDGISDEESLPMSGAHVAALIDAHERTWGLRRQVEAAQSVNWTPERAMLAARVLLDGAPRATAAPASASVADASSDPAWDVSEVAVWDDVVDEPLRAALLALLQQPVAAEAAEAAGSVAAEPSGAEGAEACGPNPALWTRQLVDRNDDSEGMLPSWTLRPEVVLSLCPPPIAPQAAWQQLAQPPLRPGEVAAEAPRARPAAIAEFEARLSALLAHCDVCFAPPPFAALPVSGGSDKGEDEEDDDAWEGQGEGGGSVDLDGSLTGSTPIVANAPQCGERFEWHIDGDPMQAAPSPWTDLHARYPNRSPRKPRLVSALLYLNGRWDAKEWGAPTKFRDPPSGAEVWVQPKPGRLVLLDQDVVHSVSAPEQAAGPERARYSLVWKLALYPPGPTPPPVRAEAAAQAGVGGSVVRLTPERAAARAQQAGREHVIGSAAWRAGEHGASTGAAADNDGGESRSNADHPALLVTAL